MMQISQARHGQKRATEYSSEEWESQREFFTNLYSVKRLKLCEAREIMLKERGFDATDRQWKRKIGQWKLEKNIKAKDKSVMVRKKLQREAEEGKTTAFVLNGRAVEDHKLERFLRTSRKVQLSSILKTPSNIAIFTPNLPSHIDNRLRGSTNSPSHVSPPYSLSLYPAASGPASASAATGNNMRDLWRPPSCPLELGWKPLSTRYCQHFASVVMPMLLDECAMLFALYTSMIWMTPWRTISHIEQILEPPNDLDEKEVENLARWMRTVLVTTQVSPNIVLLALIMIYRLKGWNPQVLGKKGSEYRIAAIALMLANKFSDDNCYTNKTWSEVSGLNLKEIEIMEIEFLSNLRYDIFVTEQEWQEWTKEFSLDSRFPKAAVRPIIHTTCQHFFHGGRNSLLKSKLNTSVSEKDRAITVSQQSPSNARETLSRESPRSTLSPEPSPGLAARLLTALSPSTFFSPKITWTWPSFFTSNSTPNLEESTLQGGSNTVSAQAVPKEELQWRTIGAAPGNIGTGTIPLIDEPWSPKPPNWSPLW